jgi:hypothetical protein
LDFGAVIILEILWLICYNQIEFMFSWIKKNWVKILYLFSLFAILYLNTFHEEYPDEYDNILGGKFIAHGILPYIGFFSHHGPVGYFLAAFLYLFSGASFVKFRIIYSIFLFLYSLGTYQYLKKSIGRIETNFYLYLLIIVGIVSTYFWGHMLIADNLSAYFILPVLALIILKAVYKKLFTSRDLIFVSILLSLALLSALTVAYLVAFLYLFCLYFYLKDSGFKNVWKNIVTFSLIMLSPYVVFVIYLLITQSFSEYVYQGIIVNQKYYVYNSLTPSGASINPIRYAIVIFHNFYYNFTNLLFQVKDFNFAFPFNITLAIANLALIVHLFIRKHYMLSILLILSLVYSNARSSPLDSSERDYQAAVYILISLFSVCFFLAKAFEELKSENEYGKKLILSIFIVLVGLYSFFNLIFVFGRFQEKVYTKYMGTSSLIYDRPDLAPIINIVLEPKDYVWIGPLDFKDYLYVNAKVASRYQFLIPAMGRSEKIKAEMLNDFKKNKPKVIFFDQNYSVLGSNPQAYAPFFVDFLRENYITLYGYKNNRYITTVPISDKVDLETKMYINKENISEIIAKLISLDLVKDTSLK